MRIKVAVAWTLWSLFALQAVDGITVRPGEISITTSKPKMKPSNRSNRTIDSEVLATSDNNRIRRLIPYMSYYYPNNEPNYYPLEYLPMFQNVQLRKKSPPPPQPQIPNIALLYGGSKYPSQQRPAVQAGFIYKARPDNYNNYQTIQQPQMQPSYNSFKYQPVTNVKYQPNVNHKPIAISDPNSFTPFSNRNKLPGDFVPIFKSKNLPYKSYDEKKYADISSHSQHAPQYHYEHVQDKMKPLDEDEFIPMHHPSPAYHNSPSISNHLIRLKNPHSDRQHKKAKPKPITYSSPSPVYVTTSEAPQTLTNHPNVPLSYDYDEIPAQPTTPSPVEYHTVKVTTFAPDERYLQNLKASSVHKYHPQDLHELPVPEILTKLQKANHLPEHLTPDNADNSIKTLVKIFNDIKQTEVASKPPPPPPIYHNQADDDYDYANYGSADDDALQDGSPGPNSGRPGIDYPNFHKIPETTFTCKDQRYKGFFGDPETNCQVWHYCDLNGGKASFLCPNGTIFSQVALTCDWWFNVKCSSTPQLYVLNERLYKYILPFTPKFPEDYSGPLVDKYLAIKYQEMEEKLQKEKDEEAADKIAKATDTQDKQPESEHENEDENEEEKVPSGSEDKPTATADESSSEDERVSYTPGPIRVPTADSPADNFISVSDLPPVPHTNVEQERIEMIEIKNVGTSGHLSHNV